MSASDHAKNLGTLLKRLASAYKPAPFDPREPMEEFVYSFLLWEATRAKADLAIKRLLSKVVDFNELRVCTVSEIIDALGVQYPRVEERAQRLLASLNEVYRREYEVSLDGCLKLTKREARAYLDSLEGMTPYVAARTTLLVVGGHAIPIDDRLAAKLREADAVDPDADPIKAAGTLERHIKATDGLDAHLLLQAWSEDAGADASLLKSAKSKRAAASSAGKRSRK